MDAKGNVLYTKGEDDVVVTLGVEDLIIVKRGDTILLACKDREQGI